MPNELEAICSLMRECGEVIRGADRENIRINAKSGPADFVTDYDKKVQDMLQRGLAGIVPDAHFIGEEGSTRPFSSEGKFFIVDPIDGTTNFIKNLHASAISVALSVMAFHILHLCIFTQVKSMNTIVLRSIYTAIMNPTACYDSNICTFSDIKIIIHNFLYSALT